jgi:hypothetical protein
MGDARDEEMSKNKSADEIHRKMLFQIPDSNSKF